MGSNNLIEFRLCVVQAVNDRNVLVTYAECNYWLPKSQMEDVELETSTDTFHPVDNLDELEKDDVINLSIPRWLAEDREFI